MWSCVPYKIGQPTDLQQRTKESELQQSILPTSEMWPYLDKPTLTNWLTAMSHGHVRYNARPQNGVFRMDCLRAYETDELGRTSEMVRRGDQIPPTHKSSHDWHGHMWNGTLSNWTHNYRPEVSNHPWSIQDKWIQGGRGDNWLIGVQLVTFPLVFINGGGDFQNANTNRIQIGKITLVGVAYWDTLNDWKMLEKMIFFV